MCVWRNKVNLTTEVLQSKCPALKQHNHTSIHLQCVGAAAQVSEAKKHTCITICMTWYRSVSQYYYALAYALAHKWKHQDQERELFIVCLQVALPDL